jgi:hypothetical protein
MHLKRAPSANSAMTAYIKLVPTSAHTYLKLMRLPNRAPRRLLKSVLIEVVSAEKDAVNACFGPAAYALMRQPLRLV